VVTCPLHNWNISLKSGEALGDDKGCVPTIPLKIDAGRIYIARKPCRPRPEMSKAAIRTTCAYCGVGCGISAIETGSALVRSRAMPTHPANFGKLCSKGTHLGETVGLEGRLLHPMIGGQRASWDEALDLVAQRACGHHRRARPGQRRLLRLRPAADRGLLRRQQADEGLHRQRQHRHQFAPVHGQRGRGAQPRLRRGCGAGSYTTSMRRTSSCWSAPTPHGAIRCLAADRGSARGARAKTRRDRSRAAPKPPSGPTCTCRFARMATSRCSTRLLAEMRDRGLAE
jgi:hypothetical protein